MREFLTGIAIILIVILTTTLVAPYFVDWNGQRDFLEARLSQALGQKVTIGGAIDLKLLPTPYLVLDQVVVGSDEGPVRVGIHHLDLELSVTPLMHGEFDITEARLEEPTIRVSLEHDRTLPALPKAPAFSADVRFERINVSDGTLAIADPSSGRTLVLDHLDLDADAASFAGPFKVSGAEGRDSARTKFRFASAAAQKGVAHAHLTIDETPTHAGYDLDGTLGLRGGATIRQSFEGNLAISGHLAPSSAVPVAWTLTGPLKADPMQAVLDGGELRLGGDEAAVTLQADAKVAFADAPKLALAVSAKQLDLDRLSGAPVDATKPPPPKLPSLDTLRGMIAAARPPLPTTLDVAIEAATYGGETLSDMQAHLELGTAAAAPLKIAADGPGGSHVALDGQIAGAARFEGKIAVEADNLPRTVDWLASVAPDLPFGRADIRFKSLKIAGLVTADASTIRSEDLSLMLDRSVLHGKAFVAAPAASTPARIVADLSADPLNLDNLPSLGGLRGDAGGIDLDLKLDAKTLKVSQLGDGGLETGHIRLALEKSGRRIALKRLQADDLGGAAIDATGSLDPDGARLAMTVDARRLDQTAALLRQLIPGPGADALVTRAAALAPARLKIDATLASANGALTPSNLSIKGKLGATSIDAATTSSEPGTIAVTTQLDAPESGALIGQLGLPTLPVATIGPSRINLTARGKTGEPLSTDLSAEFGTTTLAIDGRFALLSGAPHGTGTLHLRGADLTPLLQTLAIAFPDMTGRVPADMVGALAVDGDVTTWSGIRGRVAGTGVDGTVAWHRDAGTRPSLTGALAFDRLSLSGLLGLALGQEQTPAEAAVWSREPFTVGLIDPPRSAVSLTAKTFEILPGVEARDATLDLGLAPNLLTLDKATGALAGGRLGGELKLRHDGRQATVEGKVALDGAAVDLPALRTKLTARLDIAGSGTSALGLVSSLAGSGAATADALAIPGADPAATRKIFDDVESDLLSVDEESVVRAFESGAKPPLDAGTRHFDLSLAAGSLHFEPTDPVATDAPVTSRIDAALDLPKLRLETHVGETLHALPKNWSGPPPTIVVTAAGPLAKPAWSYDVSGFLNAVAARALARETARVEIYEFDLRERAFFNARLQSERRREQERLKAEDDARKAKAEAARQERMRREAAAKAARDRAAKDAEDKARDAQPAPDQAGQPPAAAPAPHDDRPPAAGAPDPSTLGRY